MFRSRKRRSGHGDQASEMAALRPYLELAREIRADMARVAADGTADEEALEDAVRRIPRRERDRVVREVFDALPPEARWAVVERVFGDAEIRRHLAARRDELLAAAARAERRRRARAGRRLDTNVVEVGELLVLGLFREDDVGAAVGRGNRSSGCARRLILQAVEPGRFRVIEDVFDPGGDHFVTAEYDRAAWLSERLPSHAVVRVGSRSAGPGGAFEPALYPGARLDVEVSGQVVEGRLHLGFAVVDGVDVFVDE